ncbi:hypothetical protein [Piscinibacter koreensis]|uniref:Uncharacterized protein n=1 Tax=Piscinibacter koreensis TaxID=2742824 RepID=A0A7Y6NK12_9BURK|nr:hypothetical protein [Schlegelella koreensis]NUZ04618.1 hypothetical protein [Schlegelella koreensis]
MDIRFHIDASRGAAALAEHARRRLHLRLLHRSDRVAYIAVKVGDTRSRRGHRDTYCAMRVELNGVPPARVVDVGTDAYGTIDRAVDRVGRLVETQLTTGAGDGAGPGDA